MPQPAKDCQLAGGTPAERLSPDNHKDSILALDLRSGVIPSPGTFYAFRLDPQLPLAPHEHSASH